MLVCVFLDDALLSSIYVSSPSFKMGFGQTHDKVSGGWQPLVAFLSLGVEKILQALFGCESQETLT